MTTATPPRALAALEHAVAWTSGCLELARDRSLTLPTPCSEWDLRQLLLHLEDSLVALGEAGALGHVSVDPLPRRSGPGTLVDRVLARAAATTTAWRQRITSAPIGVGDLALPVQTVLMVGALEVAVHGWDVARACGAGWELPEPLAASLLDAALLVEDRAHRFAPAKLVPPSASASVRLLAFLGRDPFHWSGGVDWVCGAG